MIGGAQPGALHGADSVVSVVLFFASWSMVAFIGGTVLMSGPLVWIVSYSRRGGLGGGLEGIIVLLVIMGFLLASGYLSYTLERWRRGRHVVVRVLLPLILASASVLTLLVWLDPTLIETGEVFTVLDGRFAFGPYPEPELLQQLSSEGFSAVITLLHPAAIPFEARLIERERELAAEHGMAFISAPMLPWARASESSVALLRRLAVEDGGKYYVHSYLGRRRILLAQETVVQAVEEDKLPNRLLAWGPFERGTVYDLGDDVYLTPFPIPAEMAEFFTDGSAAAVLSLLDPDNEGDRLWMEQERIALAAGHVDLYNASIGTSPFQPDQAHAAATLAHTLPRPLLVHAFFSHSVESRSFRQAFFSGRPPLLPDLFQDLPLSGPVRVVAPHVAVGPRPVTREFGGLYFRGIRSVAGVSEVEGEDRGLAREAGLEWYTGSMDADSLLDALEEGGPWYLYGSGAQLLVERITERYGAPLPVGSGGPPPTNGEKEE